MSDPSAIDAFLAAARSRLDRLDPTDLAAEVAAGALVVDVRPAEQRQRAGRLAGSVRADRNVLASRPDPARPTLMISSDGSTCVTYDVSCPTDVSMSMPTMAMTIPGIMSGRGPTLGSSWATTPAATMMPPLNGRNAKPDLSGLYPRLIWK